MSTSIEQRAYGLSPFCVNRGCRWVEAQKGSRRVDKIRLLFGGMPIIGPVAEVYANIIDGRAHYSAQAASICGKNCVNFDNPKLLK